MDGEGSTLQKGEYITLHVGSAGINIGQAFWLKMCTEHGVTADGHSSGTPPPFSFYSESPSGRYTPRAVLLDCDDDATAMIRRSHPKLYDPACIIDRAASIRHEDISTGGCYVRGHDTLGKAYQKLGNEQLRKMLEGCDHPKGLLLTHSCCGGTGSGVASGVLYQLHSELAKKSIIDFCLYPSERYSAVTVEPYNALMYHTEGAKEYCTCSIVMDNEALFNICHSIMGVKEPTYSDVNTNIAQVIWSLTAQDQYQENTSDSMTSFLTNLIPYPSLKYLMLSHAPYSTSLPPTGLNAFTLMHYATRPDHFTVSCDPTAGKHIAVGLNYVGKMKEYDVCIAVDAMRHKSGVKFCRKYNCVKSCVCPIRMDPSQLTLLSNNSALARKYDTLEKNFGLLYAKRTFVHWFVGEGGSEGDWFCVPYETRLLVKDYNEVTAEDDDEESGSSVE